MNKNTIFLYLHIPKTGGTSLIKHIEKNYKPEERMFLDGKTLGIDIKKPKKDHEYYMGHFKKYLSKYKETDLKKVKVVYSAIIPYGIHKYFSKNPKYITIIRDPLKRAISYYNYYLTTYYNESSSRRNTDFFRYKFLVNGKIPSFKVWVSKKYGNSNSLIEQTTMFQFFNSLGYLNNEELASITSKFYFVGITKRLSDDLPFLYHEMGFNKYFLNQNISRKYYQLEDKDSELINILNKKNEVDNKLYNNALRFNDRFKKDNPDFKKKVNEVKRKRIFILPYTQIRYDYKDTLRHISLNIKTRSSTYTKALDYIKVKLNRDPLIQ